MTHTSTKKPTLAELTSTEFLDSLGFHGELEGALGLAYRPSPLGVRELDTWVNSLQVLSSKGVEWILLTGVSPEPEEKSLARWIETCRFSSAAQFRDYFQGLIRLWRPAFIAAPSKSQALALQSAQRSRRAFFGFLDQSVVSPRTPLPILEPERAQILIRSSDLAAVLANSRELQVVTRGEENITRKKWITKLRMNLRMIRSNSPRFVEVPSPSGILASLWRIAYGDKLLVRVSGDDLSKLDASFLSRNWTRICFWLAQATSSYFFTEEVSIQALLRERCSLASAVIGMGSRSRRLTEGFELRRWGLKRMNYVVCLSGASDPGHDCVVAAMSSLGQAHRLVVCGVLPPAGIQRRNDAVIWVQSPDQNALDQILSHSWLTILADSTDRSCQVAVNQMASGHAVAGLDTPRFRELIGESELLYTGVDDLRDKINRWLNRPLDCHAWSRKAEELAERRFSSASQEREFTRLVLRISGHGHSTQIPSN